MNFFLAFLFWIFGGAGVDSPSTNPLNTNTEIRPVQVSKTKSKGNVGLQRVHHTGRRTIIVLDDTQFRPKEK